MIGVVERCGRCMRPAPVVRSVWIGWTVDDGHMDRRFSGDGSARARRDREQSEAPRGPEAAQTKQSFDEKLRAGTGMCAVGGDGIILKDGLWLHVEESEIATCTCRSTSSRIRGTVDLPPHLVPYMYGTVQFCSSLINQCPSPSPCFSLLALACATFRYWAWIRSKNRSS